MLTEDRRKHEQSDNFNKEIEKVKKHQIEAMELKNTLTALKNTIEGFNNRLQRKKGQGTRRQGTGLIQWEQQQGKRKKSEERLRDSWDSIKQTNICITWNPEEEGKRQNTYLKK